MHSVERLVDVIKVHGVGNELVDLEPAFHVFLDQAWHFGSALDATEGRAAPDTAGDQLERTGADLLAGGRHTNDGGFTPALVAGLQGGPHHVHVASAVKGVVQTAIGHVDQDLLDRLVRVVVWVHKVSAAKLASDLLLLWVGIDSNNATIYIALSACRRFRHRARELPSPVVNTSLGDAKTNTSHTKDSNLEGNVYTS